VARGILAARERGHDGYAMAALLIAMSIMAIMMTVAMPTWRQMSQREKEAELVFRGEQFARALTLFQNKNGPGTAPPSFDLLVEQRYLRKKYKDPITKDDFVPILLTAARPGSAPGTAPAPGTPAGARGATATPAVQTTQRGGTSTTPGTTPGAGPAGGIMGVTSKSKEQSIRLYKGRTHYNEWQFTPVVRTAAPGAGGQGAPGVGGQRGNQGNPQGPQNPFGGAGGRQGNPPAGGRGPFGPGNPPPGPNNPNGPNRGGQPFNPFQPPPTRSGR
jgi:type II secretory pathway pseudopilin PulG